MLAFGLWVIGYAIYGLIAGANPEPQTMGLIGTLALVVNVVVALLLFRYREGDANMRSVWICSRNDAIGNIAVLGAALGVFGTEQAWPDLLVASIMAGLAIWGSLRSEEHTSELQSLMRLSYAVFCLKKKTNDTNQKLKLKYSLIMLNTLKT